MQKIKIWVMTGASTAILLLSGCASQCVSVPSTSKEATSFGSGFGQLKALPPSSREVDGFLQANITVKNKKSSTQNFQYQVQWFDQSGYNTGQPQPWTPVEVYADLSKTLSLTAPMQNARSYNIEFCAA
ncbi:MAG: DUF1425 domain-containing protein [Francisellaceae bacterium]